MSNDEEALSEEEPLLSEEERLSQEVNDYKDKYTRLLAESENQRKRLQKERIEATRYAVSNLACEFLHPLDHLENALRHAQESSSEVQQWAFGFKMILEQFQEVLHRNGIYAFESVGKPFDHDCHEAIDLIETSDVEPGTVVMEYLKGYRIDGRVIRPARVKVAKAPKEDLETNTESEEEHE